jgi:transcriptional regulator with XRE-family HTH domain
VSSTINFELLAQEWIRAMRGDRSQRALSKLLGYESNIAYRWETGRAQPSASAVLRAMDAVGFDVAASLHTYYGGKCPWLNRLDPTSREGVAHLLDDLRGKVPLTRLATRTGYTRYQLTRWLQSSNEPRLQDLLRLIEALSHRSLDFVAAFFGPAALPSVAAQWQRLVNIRVAAYEHPESHLVLRALELKAYQALPQHRPGFIAERLKLTRKQEQQSLELLEAAGQIELRAGKWVTTDEPFVDTRSDAARSRKLKAFWLRRAADAVEQGAVGTFGYNLFSISEADLVKVNALHRRYYAEMSEIIGSSQPNERVVLFAAQLFTLDAVQPPES